MTQGNKDQVFSKPLSNVKTFEFDDKVASVFDDMISRSVPGYQLILRLIGLFADVFVENDTKVYDLGCSLGEASRIIGEQTRDRQCEIVAVDNSEAMIERCIEYDNPYSIQWICDDIQNINLSNASMAVLNLTLQFIDKDQRLDMLTNIANGLKSGGVLVLTEKIESPDPLEQNRMTEMYHAFKKSRGYSELEISQKRTALENVLVSDSHQVHIERLKSAGFSEVYRVYHCFMFTTYLAIK